MRAIGEQQKPSDYDCRTASALSGNLLFWNSQIRRRTASHVGSNIIYILLLFRPTCRPYGHMICRILETAFNGTSPTGLSFHSPHFYANISSPITIWWRFTFSSETPLTIHLPSQSPSWVGTWVAIFYRTNVVWCRKRWAAAEAIITAAFEVKSSDINIILYCVSKPPLRRRSCSKPLWIELATPMTAFKTYIYIYI